MRNLFEKTGYSPEDLYFDRLNRELVERMKAKERDQERRRKEEALYEEDNEDEGPPSKRAS